MPGQGILAAVHRYAPVAEGLKVLDADALYQLGIPDDQNRRPDAKHPEESLVAEPIVHLAHALGLRLLEQQQLAEVAQQGCGLTVGHATDEPVVEGRGEVRVEGVREAQEAEQHQQRIEHDVPD